MTVPDASLSFLFHGIARKCERYTLVFAVGGGALWGAAPARLDPEVLGGSVRKYSTIGQYRERWRESMRRESRRVLSFRAS